AWLAAPVPLLALTGQAMADNIRPVAVGTVQDLENHDATQSRWGGSAAKTLIENSTSTPVRHLRHNNKISIALGHTTFPSMRRCPTLCLPCFIIPPLCPSRSSPRLRRSLLSPFHRPQKTCCSWNSACRQR